MTAGNILLPNTHHVMQMMMDPAGKLTIASSEVPKVMISPAMDQDKLVSSKNQDL